ncbi:kinase suppressor of Ras 2-like [Littorina saxatilis]|uniref:Kinase suppressor of Ras 2 n=1 Tax=Littorina saxatilis TaxID=31220 RepID=A0AAN9AJ74_9CAEN
MSSSKDREEAEKQAIKTCTTNQCMIDFTAKHLNGLRIECATTEEITQKEIREAESKLIKLFSNQLVAKQRLKGQEFEEMPECLEAYPRLQQWLIVVGLKTETIKGILGDELSFDALMRKEESDLRSLLKNHGASERDFQTLQTAFRNLKLCTEIQLKGKNYSHCDWHFTDLFVGSKSASGSPSGGGPNVEGGSSPKMHPRSSSPSTELAALSSVGSSNPSSCSATTFPSLTTTSVPSFPIFAKDIAPHSAPSSPLPSPHIHPNSQKYTPPPTPPLNRQKPVSTSKYPSTPPPMKKLLLFPDAQPIQKSKSHESQLANRVVDIDPVKTKKKPQNIKLSGSHEALFLRRLSAEGAEMTTRGLSGHSSPVTSSPVRSPPCKQDVATVDDTARYTLTVPRSPKTPVVGPKLHHQIFHRFTANFVLAPCDQCASFVIRGKVCRFCKKKFHKECATKAPPACGLSDAQLDYFLEWSESPVPDRRRTNPSIMVAQDELSLKPNNSMPNFPGPLLQDSGSNTSSCNSSSPSSPAYPQTSSGTVTSPSPAPSSPRIQFRFPDIDRISSLPPDLDVMYQRNENDGDDVVSTNTSNDSEKTLIDSNTSERNLLDRVDSMDSQDDPLGHSWNRQNSLAATMKEWDIPFEDLAIGDSIGKGRFGTVHKGHWHGDVAIKLLDMGNDSDNQAQLAAFRLELAMLRKTRHENLVLFMGACMKPPRLAIVTSFCKGETLYTLIHMKKDTFKINKAMIIASQVAQGMSYLHARSIIHKDLRSKNIFIDAGRVVITDFGLFHVTKICRGSKKDDWLSVPRGWLCYLAPEIIRALKALQHSNMDLPFTEKSDLYAFGTVWYELLCNEWPFRSQPCETVIWQVGCGMKQSLSTVNAPREVKDILMSCWAYQPQERPDFVQITKALERVPRTRLIRSPSHPVHLSRSTEGIFQA